MTPERWLAVTVTCPSDDLAGFVAEGLVALGAGGVEELPGAIRAWLPCPPGGERQQAEAVRTAMREHTGHDLHIDWSVAADTDWMAQWRRGLRPRRVGERLVVAPTWTKPDLRPGDVLLTIDPEMAFGTGEHATTRGMLRLLERSPVEGASVLDVGTGSAILAIAAALLGARHVDAAESDPDALLNARDNVTRHGVADRVRLLQALVDPVWLERAGGYDIILANILSSVIVPLLPAFGQALRPGGALLVSGILQTEASLVAGAAMAAGFATQIEDREDEWWSAYLVSV